MAECRSGLKKKLLCEDVTEWKCCQMKVLPNEDVAKWYRKLPYEMYEWQISMCKLRCAYVCVIANMHNDILV